jgi:hypothetical protein
MSTIDFIILIICLLLLMPVAHYLIKPEPLKCGITLPGIPGKFCQKQDGKGIYYENERYRVTVK